MATHYYGTMIITVQGLELLIVDLKTLKPIERVHKELPVGDDLYGQQPISFELVNQMTSALRGFLQILNDYQIDNYQLWGSEALSRAINADFISDQVFLRTGIKLNWLSISEETYYRNQAVLVDLRQQKTKSHGKLIHLIGINSGNTTVTQFSELSFVYSSHYSLGPVKIAEDLQSLRQSAPNSMEVLRDYIDSKLADYQRLLPQEAIDGPSEVILLGAMPLSSLTIEGEHHNTLTADEFDSIFDRVVDASDQFLVEQYGIKEAEVPLLLPEILLLRKLMRLTQATSIHFSHNTVLDGLAINEAVRSGFSHYNFSEQTITAAANMANHYRVEPVHRQLVTKFALHLFDQLKPVHQLTPRDRLLLQVASILHDVGAYVDAHEHYLHSDYIIQHTSIIGLSVHERQLIAAISRYHSTTTPSEDLSHFQKLDTSERLLVAKLSAILRLADALDDDRQQKITRISVSVKNQELIITVFSNDNLLFENWEFSFKSRFFEETFGLKPRLKQRSMTSK
ncbi:exopolyphosphatase [Secundilactobacillus folii]|uniref:Exopolyphosphatase n=1 Tax=Secundilactobacillus folii TaxID=2678357 RepID=A0A7X2XVK2_9LACO|nr:exopolyphosphatase [Secundilactobacillus folii]MTV82477.1 exopolyphosphatase [Secundilactobacillus folii]